MTQSGLELRDLVSQLPHALQPVVPATVPAGSVVEGVHISELVDPTPFLYGGELLLTTGMALPLTAAGVRAYVLRLVRRRVIALGVGLGPVHGQVPDVLVRACTRQGLALLVVPREASFQQVTRAYWSMHSEAHERTLHAALDNHRRLVSAATSADPVPAVLQLLGRSIEGEVFLMDAHGDVRHRWPADGDPSEDLRAVGDRIRTIGGRSAATFPVGERLGSLHPIVVQGTVGGYLCTVSATPLEATNRGLLLAALAMLGLDAHHRRRGATGDRLLRSAVASLVDRGQLQAVRGLVATLPVEAPPPRVRVAALRTAPGQADAALVALADTLPDHGWWAVAGDRTVWVMAHPGLVPLGTQHLTDVVAKLGDRAVATLGPLVDLADVHVMRTRLETQVLGLSEGTVRAWNNEDAMPFVTDEWARSTLAPLLGRPAVLTAVAALLRHQGSWERAARDLGIHRNSLRARIGKAERHLGGSLADPDLASRVWIALRATGFDKEGG